MPERRALEAVIFDAGGTLVRLDFEWMSELLRQRTLDVPVARLRRGEIAGRRAYDASRGRAPAPGEPPPPLGSSGTTNAYFGGMLEAAGVPADAIEWALGEFEKRHAQLGLWTRPLEGAREALDGINALGLRAAVVSNSDGRAEQHLIDTGVREGLEFVVDSHLVGIEKPDPRILALALGRLGVAPDRTLFVGDIRSVDAAVAQAAGTHFTLVDPFADYGEGLDSIRSMSELPAHVARQFATPRGGPQEFTPIHPARARERSAS